MKKEIDKLVDEIMREIKKIYGFSTTTPFTAIDWKKGRRTLKQAILEFHKNNQP